MGWISGRSASETDTSGPSDPDGGSSPAGRWRLSRRQFIGYGSATGAVVLTTTSCGPPGGDGPGSLNARLRRSSDQLDLEFDFFNLELVTDDGPARLEKLVTGEDAYMAVRFGPQALADRAFAEPGEAPTAPPVQARLAGQSRLAFVVPDALLPLEYSAANLLRWIDLIPRVVPNAYDRDIQPGDQVLIGALDPREPAEDETAIELPWRLVLSPHAGSAWAHRADPTVHDGRVELWHTRLAVKGTDGNNQPTVDEDDDAGRTVRAVWSRDPFFGFWVNVGNAAVLNQSLGDDDPFRMSLNARDRLDLVRLSSDWRLAHGGRTTSGELFQPEPVDVEHLILSGLGGWLDSSWDNDLDNDANQGHYQSSLLQWRHTAAQGRDSYARVVNKGWLMPFGFKATKVTETERQFDHVGGQANQPKGAYLRQRTFLVITRPTRRYASDEFMANDGRRLPFASLVCLTRVTPDLLPEQQYVPEHGAGAVFVPSVGTSSPGEPFEFQMRATDWAGNDHIVNAPGVFVDDTVAYLPGHVGPIIAEYNNLGSTHGVGAGDQVDLQGAKVALGAPKVSGDTTFGVSSMAFEAEAPTNPADLSQPYDPQTLAAAGRPGFYPALHDATISLSEVGEAAGSAVPPSVLAYYAAYVLDGFGNGAPGHPNKGDVLLGPPPTAHPISTLAVGTKSGGGIGAPAVGVQGVSREIGPTGDPDDTSSAKFTPSKYLEDGVTILGGVLLVEVLEAVSDFFTEDGKDQSLKMKSRREPGPERVITDIDWHPKLVAGPGDLNLIAPEPGGAVVDIHTEVVTNLDAPEESSVDIQGHMADFVLMLFGGEDDGSPDGRTFIRVPVKRLDFTAGTLSAEELHTELGDISFHGVLKFVEKLSEVMAFGDGGGLKIDVNGDGIQIELSIALPDITLGVMSLTNMAIFLGVKIPFDGSPVELYFSFCSRENPFTLTVWVFGGGGFVGLAVSARGVELLEFSFEFGGGFALDLGIASGKVEVKAGLYFKLETITDTDGNGNEVELQQCLLEAYLRMGGSVSILGIVTVSVEFYLGLTYTDPPGSLVGEATMTVEVEVLFISGSVSLTVRKELAGGDGGGGGALKAGPALFAGDAPAATLLGAGAESVAQPGSGGPKITFGDLWTEPEWATYASAFAPAGA